ncbi:putative cysteine--tRNA ligase mitochondrial [Bienertia sinuspersici]
MPSAIEAHFSAVIISLLNLRSQCCAGSMEGEKANSKESGSSSSSVVYGDVLLWKSAKNMIKRSLRTPMVKFLRENLEKSGCSIGDNFIKAENWNRKLVVVMLEA